MSHNNAIHTPKGRLRLARCIVEDHGPLHRAAARDVPANASNGGSSPYVEPALGPRPDRVHAGPAPLHRAQEGPNAQYGLLCCRHSDQGKSARFTGIQLATTASPTTAHPLQVPLRRSCLFLGGAFDLGSFQPIFFLDRDRTVLRRRSIRNREPPVRPRTQRTERQQ